MGWVGWGWLGLIESGIIPVGGRVGSKIST